MEKLKAWDLFAGVGGFSLGLHRTGGFETTLFVEIEPFCQKVLQKNFPGVPIHDDIRTLDCDRYERPDVITGGYPCQPYSLAGKRQGATDDRHLWPEMYRVIQETRPSWVIGENVAGHINMGLDEVLSDMESIGYACQPFVIPACSLNAPHRRDRVWWVAANTDFFGLQEREHERKTCGDQAQRKQARDQAVRVDAQESSTNTKCREQPQQFSSGRMGRLRQFIPARWDWSSAPEPTICRVDDGVPNRLHRLKALGNAVVPQIPELIGRAIMEHD